MTKQIDALRKALSLLETLSVHASMSDEHRNEVSIVRLVLRDAITEGNRRAESDLLAALKELVQLKDIKERMEKGEAAFYEQMNYISLKDMTWQAARAAVARHEHE